MQVIQKPVLRPVIELEPGDYASEERQSSPTWLSKEADDWVGALAHSGLQGLRSISSGSWFVLVEDFEPSHLVVVLRNYLLGIGIPGFPDSDGEVEEDLGERVGALSGGYALYDDDRPMLEPTCCCDLADLSEWRRLINQGSPEWEALTIGHAILSLRVAQDAVELREVAEYPPRSVAEFVMPPNLARLALEDVSSRQRFFEARVTTSLRELSELADYSEEQFAVLGRLLAGREDR